MSSSTIGQTPAESAVKAPLPACPAETDPWIFRDGRRACPGRDVLRGILDCFKPLGAETLIDALIQAGELEASLSDSGVRDARIAVELTDSLAEAACSGDEKHQAKAVELAERIHFPEWINISPPEGFTYYALHPLDFSRVTQKLPIDPRPLAVLGIRSIGTTLSAVVTAALKLDGRSAERITVRPEGHPYDRKMQFTADQKKWIHRMHARSACFLIVDEGPGRSGSTFFSVAEALLRAGVSRQQITIIGSREPDPAALCASNAASRWTQFRFISTSPAVNARFTNYLYAGGGAWREILMQDESYWPENWPSMERLKFISPDRHRLFKFEGMGRVGSECRQRAFALAEAGFSPIAANAGGGFLEYKLLSGNQTRATEVNSSLIDFMAQYCAFRNSNFKVKSPVQSEIGQMVEFNLRQEFGIDVQFDADEFRTTNPIIVDGKMQPHEWILDNRDNRRRSIRFFKTDAVDHGDDHFFPGPCDIAWDLAGIAVEWELPSDALDRLVEKFCAFSGTPMPRIAERIPAYLLAYSTFRLGFCKMASSAVSDCAEKRRLHAAYRRYRNLAHDLVAKFSRPSSRPKVDNRAFVRLQDASIRSSGTLRLQRSENSKQLRSA